MKKFLSIVFYCWVVLFCASCGGDSGSTTKEPILANDVPILNQDTTGTASNVTSVVEISNGGTGSSTSQTAINALVGTSTSGQYLRSDGTNALMSSIQASDIPTLNQNTTGTATNVTGKVEVLNGGTGSTTQQSAINTLAGATTSGSYLRGDGSNIVMSGIQVADVPTLNQNTTGTSANVTGVVAVANGGTGSSLQQIAMNTLAGATTSGQFLRGNGTNVLMTGIQIVDVPTLNQNTTGTSANVTGVVAIANGGTGQNSKTAAFDALSPSTTKGDLILHNGTNNLRLAVGTNNQVLAADSAQATGVKWTNAASPDAFSYRQVGANNDMASAADKVSYYVCGQAATHASSQTGTVFGPVSFTAMPFIQTQAVNVVKMAVVVTVVGSANSKIRFGLYSNKSSSTFYPDALLLDCGEVAGDVLGVKEVVVSLALPANSLIWGAVWANDGGGGTRPTMRSIRSDAGQVLNILGWNGDFTNQCTNIAAPLNAYVTGTALPATFPTGGNRGVGNIPVVALQFGP